MYLNDDDIKNLELRFYEDDFNEYLKQLIDMNMIGDLKELGIAKKVLEEGYDSLSYDQKKVFLFYVIKPNYIKECSRCLSEIPWSEMINSLDESNKYCGYCSHMNSKDE